MRNRRNKRNRKFKKAVFRAGIIGSILISTNVVSYNVGKNINKNNMQKEYNIGYEEGKKSQEDIINSLKEKNTPITPNVIESNKDLVVDYVLNLYNGLGNDLSRDNLGLVKSSTMYLYEDINSGGYILDNANFKGEDYYKEVPDDEKSDVYIYVDKTRKSKPIAGIAKINDKNVNVNIRSYSSNEGIYNTIEMDVNNYVNFMGTDEDMENYFLGTEEYLDERIKKVR